MKKILGTIFILIMFLFPTDAFGAVTGLSFGGKVFAYFQCTCSPYYYLFIGPPSAGLTLTYLPGSQAYSKYSLPLGRQILGLYNPFVTTMCLMTVGTGCTTIPSRGMIMPMVGNSI